MGKAVKAAVKVFVITFAITTGLAFVFQGAGLFALGQFGAAGAFLGGVSTLSLAALSATSTLIGGLMSKGTQATAENFGTKVASRTSAAPRQIIYGKARVGGTITHIETSGTDNYKLSMIVVLAGHEVESLEEVLVNDTKLTTTSSGGFEYATNSRFTNSDNENKFGVNNSLLRYKFKDGSQTTADSTITGATSLGSTDKFIGMAYMLIEMVFDSEAFGGGIPPLAFVIKGKKVYDPRTSTTAWSDNPALCVRDYITDTTYGLKATSDEVLDTTALGGFASAANTCENQAGAITTATVNGVVSNTQTVQIDYATSNTLIDIGQTVTGTGISGSPTVIARRGNLITLSSAQTIADGVTITFNEDLYKANGITDMTADGSGVLEGLLSSCAGKLSYINGKFVMFAGASVTPDMTITDDNLLAPISIATKQTSGESFNTVKAVYVDANNNYVATDSPVYTDSTLLSNDTPTGESSANYRKSLEIQLPFTDTTTMAQRLQRTALLHTRQEVSLSVLCNIAFMQLQPFDWVYLTNERLGYTNKTFEVLSTNLEVIDTDDVPILATRLALKEIDSSVYSFASSSYTNPIDEGSSVSTGSFSVTAPTNLSLTVDLQLDSTTSKVNIDASWTNNPDDLIQGTEILYGTSSGTYIGSILVGKGKTKAVIPNLMSNSDYYVVARHFSSNNVFSPNTGEQSVNTGLPAAPSAPSNLSATTGKALVIGLEWDAPSNSDLRAVKVYRHTSSFTPTDDTYLVSTITSEPSETQKITFGLEDGLTAGTTYHFAVRAINHSGTHSSFTSTTTGSFTLVDAGDIDLPEFSGYFHKEGTTTTALTSSQFNTEYGRQPLVDDILIMVNTSASPKVSKAYKWSGSAFVEITNFTTGDLVVDGTLAGDKIIAQSISADRVDTDFISTLNLLTTSATVTNNITIGTGNNVFKAETGVGIQLGHATFSSAPFRVTEGGALTATNATITGEVNATSGTFNGSIAIGSGNSIFKADSNGIYLGNATFGSAPFRVTPAGAVTATSATITGTLTLTNIDGTTVTYTGGQLGVGTIGVGNLGSSAIFPTTLRYERSNSTSAPSNSEFNTAFGRNPRSNDIVVVSRTDTNAQVAYKHNGTSFSAISNYIDGDLIVDGSITTDQLAANSVEANQINVGTLSAISANMGSITAGDINIGSGAFTVTSAGVLDATGATIGGSFSSGSGNSIFKADTNGIYLGNATFGSAPFRVSTAGALTATSGTIGGVTLSTNKIHLGTGTFNNSNTAFYVDTSGQFSLKDKLSFDGADLVINGKVKAPILSATGQAGLYSLVPTSITGGSDDAQPVISADTDTDLGTVILATDDPYDSNLWTSGSPNTSATGLWLGGSGTIYMLGTGQSFRNSPISSGINSLGTSSNGWKALYLHSHSSFASTTNALYSIGGSLYFNGSQLGTGSGDITGVTITTTGGSLTGGAAFTSGAASFTLDIGSTITGAKTFDNNVVIQGNLDVQGTTTTIDTANLDVKDKNITLNYGTGDTSANANGAGITIQDAVNSTTDATILWDTTSDEFDFSHGINVTGELATTSTINSGGNININASGTGERYLQIGNNTTDNHFAYIDLVGDTTYTDYGLRLIRNNTGANTSSGLVHRGTGNLDITAVDSANLRLRTASLNRLVISSIGDISFYEDTGTTAKFFWDASAERLGIGNTAPTSALDVTGTVTADGLNLGTNDYITMGGSGEVQIFDDGTNSVIRSSNNILIQRNTSPRTSIKVTDSSGEVELSYAGSPKLATTSTGIDVTGNVTATAFYGDGSNLTGVTSTTINNNADNRIITGSGTANTLNAESGLTYDGSTLSGANIQMTGNINASGVTANNVSGNVLKIDSTTVVDNSRNLTNIASLNLNGKGSATSIPRTFAIANTGGNSNRYIKFGTISSIAQSGRSVKITVSANNGYNASNAQNTETIIRFKTSNNSSNQSGFYGDCQQYRYGESTASPSDVLVKQVSSTEFEFYGLFGNFTGNGSIYTVEHNDGVWTHSGSDTGATAPSGTVLTATRRSIFVSGTNNFNADFNIGTGTISSGAITSTGNLLLDVDNAEINLKSGAGTTSGAVNWTFNTTGTDYASIKLPYATRATTGFHIDSGYPLTLDATSRINFAISGNTRFRITNTDFEVGTTPIIDLNRNLTNIGTISSGAITSTGTSTFDGIIVEGDDDALATLWGTAPTAIIGGFSSGNHDGGDELSNFRMAVISKDTNGGTSPVMQRNQVWVTGGISGEAYNSAARWDLGRWENNSTDARSRLDLYLADNTQTWDQVMTWRHDGTSLKVGIQTTTPSATLDVNGTINSGTITATSYKVGSTTVINSSGQIIGDIITQNIDMSTGNNRITFDGDTSTGLFYDEGEPEFVLKGSTATPLYVEGLGIRSGSINTDIIDQSRNLTNIGTISSGAITANSSSTSTFAGSGYVNFSANVGGVGVNGTQGLHIGWNKSNGGREINMIFDGGTTQAETEMIFTSTDGTNYSDIFQINGGGDVDIKNGGLRVANTTVIDSSRNLTNIGTISSGAITSTGNVLVGESGGAAYASNANGVLYFGDDDLGDHLAYSIGTKRKENIGGDYTKLNIDWHTGITLGASPAYGGIRFFDNSVGHYNATNKYFSVGEGSSDVKVYNDLNVVSNIEINGQTVIDSSRNLTNIGTITSTGIVNIGSGTSYFSEKLLVSGRTRVAGQLDIALASGYSNYGTLNHDDSNFTIGINRVSGTGNINLAPHSNVNITSGGLQINGSTVIDSSSNLTNIGTISSGAITVNNIDQGFTARKDVASGAWSARIVSKNATTNVAAFLGNYNGYAGLFGHNYALDAWSPVYINNFGGTSNSNVYLGQTYVAGIFHMGTTPVIDASRAFSNVTSLTIDSTSNSASLNYGSSGSRTFTKNDAGATASQSGFFETVSPSNYYSGASSWQHLMEARHSNNSNNYAMQIAGSFFDQNFYGRKTNGYGTTSWTQFAMHNTTVTFSEVRSTGNVTAYYSDERLKDFTGKIDNAIDKVKQLNGYYFKENKKAKELGYDNDKQQVGVNAQEVQKVLPEVIDIAPISHTEGVDEEYLTVHYEKLVPLLIEAIKDQQQQIDELKARLDDDSSN